MRFIVWWVLLFSVLVQKAEAQEHVRFRVASYNVRQVNAADTGTYAFSSRGSAVVAALRSANADVFGLQEASHDMIRNAVQEEFGEDYDHIRPSGGSPKLIYFRRSRFERLDPHEEGNIYYSNPYAEGHTCHPNASGRTAAWVKLRDKMSGRVYLFVNTHTAHAAACWSGRLSEGEELRELLDSLADPSVTIIVMGDFNLDEQRSPAGDSRDRMITEVESAGSPYRLRRSARWTGSTTASLRTFNSSWKGSSSVHSRLDYIFVDAIQAATYRQAVDTRTIRELLGSGANHSPSDHFLIRAEIGPLPFAFHSVLTTRENFSDTDHLSFGDVDGDRAVDMIAWKSTVEGGRVRVHLADGAGGFSASPILDTDPGVAGEWRYFADVDGDRCADRISWSPSIDGGAMRVARSTCDGGFASAESASAGATDSETLWLFAFLDGDRCVDRLAWSASVAGGRTRTSISNCDGTFTDLVENDDEGRTTQSNADVWLADINADGLADKLVWHPDESEGKTRIYTGNGDGTFTFLHASGAGPSGSTETQFDFGDVDGDGSAEKLFWRSTYRQGFIQLYPGDSMGFNPHPCMVNSGDSTSASNRYELADVNGDGSADLVRYDLRGANPDHVRVYLAAVTHPQPEEPEEPDEPDAGVMDGGVDGGVTDAGWDASSPLDAGADVGGDAGDDERVGREPGCSCRVAARHRPPWALFGLFALLLWRRRSSRSSGGRG